MKTKFKAGNPKMNTKKQDRLIQPQQKKKQCHIAVTGQLHCYSSGSVSRDVTKGTGGAKDCQVWFINLLSGQETMMPFMTFYAFSCFF